MYSDLKPSRRWEVKAWTHDASGERLAVYYSPRRCRFWAHIANVFVLEDTQAAAEKRATEVADERLAREDRWERVLVIEGAQHMSPTGTFGNYRPEHQIQSARIGFSVYRAWRLVTWEGAWLTRSWDQAALGSMRGTDIHGFTRPSAAAKVIPYTDALWERFRGLAQRLGQVRADLDQALHSDDVAAQLMAGTLPLLGDGK